jgi:PAS domain S-box-containing protein
MTGKRPPVAVPPQKADGHLVEQKVQDPMVLLKGEKHVITKANDGFCSLLDRSREDIIGRPMAEVIPADSALIGRLDEVYRTGKIFSHEEQIRAESDPLYWSYTCMPWMGGSGTPEGVTMEVTGTNTSKDRARKINEAFLIGSLRQHEISTRMDQRNDLLKAELQERDRLDAIKKENERQFKTLANSIPHLAWMARPDGRIFWYNKRWSSFTGTRADRSLHQDWAAVIHPDDLPRVMDTIATAFASGKAWEETFRLRRHDGVMVWHLSRMMAICGDDGVVLRWFGTHTDVTSERELEQNLREHGVELELIGKRRNEFLATLAHELRNPLAPLRNGLDMLEISDDAQTRVTIQAMMRRQVDQMVLLVDDLMDLNRISRGSINMRFERLDVRTMIDRAVESTATLIEKQGHTLMLDMPVRPVAVMADGMRLVQIFSNLLNNAAKYTDPGGKITVKVKVHGRKVSIAVHDTGIGLPADQLDKVFDMFAQVERGTDRVQGGLGIGLHIVKQLVGMHKGTIDVYSAGPLLGSVFTVHLPAAEPAVEVPSQEEVPRNIPPTVRRRILVVDDNADAASIISWLLEKLGHDVRKADNGRDALAVGDAFQPEIVIMDIGMPLMNGHEACRLMRLTAWGRAAFIVALTGLGAEHDREQSDQAGFDHHLVKPVGKESFIALIEQAASR